MQDIVNASVILAGAGVCPGPGKSKGALVSNMMGNHTLEMECCRQQHLRPEHNNKHLTFN